MTLPLYTDYADYHFLEFSIGISGFPRSYHEGYFGLFMYKTNPINSEIGTYKLMMYNLKNAQHSSLVYV